MPKNIVHILEKRDHMSIHKLIFGGFSLAKQQLGNQTMLQPKKVPNHTGTHPQVKIQINNKQQSTLRPPQHQPEMIHRLSVILFLVVKKTNLLLYLATWHIAKQPALCQQVKCCSAFSQSSMGMKMWRRKREWLTKKVRCSATTLPTFPCLKKLSMPPLTSTKWHCWTQQERNFEKGISKQKSKKVHHCKPKQSDGMWLQCVG